MTTLDLYGISGMAVDTALIFLFSGGALLCFVYFWIGGRLDMDEEAKHQMLKEEE